MVADAIGEQLDITPGGDVAVGQRASHGGDKAVNTDAGGVDGL